MLTSLKLKLVGGFSIALVVVSFIAYIHWQANKLTQAENALQSVERDLLEAHIAFDSQQSAYNRVRHELTITEQVNIKLRKSLIDIETKHSNLQQSLVELRKQDNEVNEYLNTDIPNNLLEWLHQRSN